jgi:hypothetical protein
MLSLKMGSFRAVFIEFLSNLGSTHFQDPKDRRSFMINNLDFIINTLKQLSTPGDQGTYEIDYYFKDIHRFLSNLQQ